MESLGKLETVVLGWFKKAPHLPEVARRWLGDNVWWIALIGAILSGIGIIVGLTTVLGVVAVLGSVGATYYAAATFTSWSIVTGLVGIAFSVLQVILLSMAIKPLQNKQKKGWVILFAGWLLGIISVVVGALLTLNPITFVFNILFGAIFVAISGYFLFEIHGQFAHALKSHGVKEAEKAKGK